MKIKEPPGGGWSPSIVIQGKLYHNISPLRPDYGVQPQYCQVYVLDAQYEGQETDLRFKNCRIPAGASQREKQTIKELLEEPEDLDMVRRMSNVSVAYGKGTAGGTVYK